MSTITSINTLAQFLDVASLRQRIFAQNVANVNTSSSQALEVSFEKELQRHLGLGGSSSFAEIEPKVVESSGSAIRVDGNNVDIDKELGRLEKNGLLYQALAQVMALKLNQMRSAISGR